MSADVVDMDMVMTSKDGSTCLSEPTLLVIQSCYPVIVNLGWAVAPISSHYGSIQHHDGFARVAAQSRQSCRLPCISSVSRAAMRCAFSTREELNARPWWPLPRSAPRQTWPQPSQLRPPLPCLFPAVGLAVSAPLQRSASVPGVRQTACLPGRLPKIVGLPERDLAAISRTMAFSRRHRDVRVPPR